MSHTSSSWQGVYRSRGPAEAAQGDSLASCGIGVLRSLFSSLIIMFYALLQLSSSGL